MPVARGTEQRQKSYRGLVTCGAAIAPVWTDEMYGTGGSRSFKSEFSEIFGVRRTLLRYEEHFRRLEDTSGLGAPNQRKYRHCHCFRYNSAELTDRGNVDLRVP